MKLISTDKTFHLPFQAYTGEEPFVFISYAHKDGAVVYPEMERLHQLGLRIWYDEGIEPGQEWPEDVARALDRCAFFLVFISPRAVASSNVRNEINYALNHQKLFLAVYLEETTLPKGLELRMGDLQAIQLAPPERYQRQVESALVTHGLLLKQELLPKQTAAFASPPAVIDSAQEVDPPPTVGPALVSQGTKQVALLYKRDAQPDEYLLKMLETRLRDRGHKVFIDRHLAIGVEWGREIERQIKGADAVIPLLSAASITSEMMALEVQMAQEARQRQDGKPRLLPVRINYQGPLPEILAAILDPLEYTLWTGSGDDRRLVLELEGALLNPAPLKKPELPRAPASTTPELEAVGGAVPLDSKFYVVRPTDAEFLSAIARQDSIVLVKGARQMGKTSLLARGLQQARAAGARVVLTDFQTLNASHLASADSLFRTLGEMIAEQLDLDVYPEEVWKERRGPSLNFRSYLRREVFGNIPGPLVWGLDEVDRLFTCDFASEVFGLFRSWHNERALDPTSPWNRLTQAIAYATEAHLFITDVNQSPFNVGTRVTLQEFTFEEVADLNARHGSPLEDNSQIARYYRLVGGHPYLVRRGLHVMATEGGISAFESGADRDDGPVGDHLRRILVLLAQNQELCEVMREVLRGRTCPTQESFYRLRSAGIISGETPREARPRCQLYASYLERHLL